MQEKLQRIIDKNKHIVFFGGAGVSTESGIRDFRGSNGLYKQKFAYSPETMLSHSFFEGHTLEFYDFYRDVILAPHNGPSRIHYKLAEMEESGKLDCIITQNIDGLHQLAGSKNVIEMHGSVHKNYCLKCSASYTMPFVKQSTGLPACTECGNLVRPDVVLYEEHLDQAIIEASFRAVARADVLIVAGSSLLVYPAASLLDYFQGNELVLINKDSTPKDSLATLLLHEGIGEALCE